MELLMEGTLEKESEQERLNAFLKQLCEGRKIKIEEQDDGVVMEICPLGKVVCSYAGRFVSIAALGGVAGAGFHAFVCELFDDILHDSGITFTVNDPSGYYEQRSFEDLKYGYYYRWLKELAEDVKNDAVWCAGFEDMEYQPLKKEGYVACAMGYLPRELFVNGALEELADRFFIWNEREKTARYYRNCAWTLIWRECAFSYSAMNEATDKSAHSILSYLEAAYDKDNEERLPLAVYRKLCETLGREPLLTHAEDDCSPLQGYRSGMVSYYLDHWLIAADGCAERSFDRLTQTLCLMAPYKADREAWRWLLKANAYTVEKEEEWLSLFDGHTDAVLDSFAIHGEGFAGKAVVQDMGEYLTLIAQLICGKDVLFLEGIAKDMEAVRELKSYCLQTGHQAAEVIEPLHS